MQNTVLEVSNITKQYGEYRALKDVSIRVKRGDIYGLVGNNGAGKTTLMRIMTGQSEANSGELRLWGELDAGKIQKCRKRTGALIENPGFFEHMTARQNLEYIRIQFGIPGKEPVEWALKEVGLADTGKKKYKNFSLGMKQRLGIAAAIMHSPELLILDEPINGLDPSGIIEVRNMLLRLNEKKNTTIIISSHILTELSNVATQYGFLNKGVLLEEISSQTLMKKCNTYLDLEVNDVKKMVVLMEKHLNLDQYKVYPDNHIHLFQGFDQTAEISKLAVVNEIALLSLNKRSVDLENYYMNLIGGNSDDSVYEE